MGTIPVEANMEEELYGGIFGLERNQQWFIHVFIS